MRRRSIVADRLLGLADCELAQGSFTPSSGSARVISLSFPWVHGSQGPVKDEDSGQRWHAGRACRNLWLGGRNQQLELVTSRIPRDLPSWNSTLSRDFVCPLQRLSEADKVLVEGWGFNVQRVWGFRIRGLDRGLSSCISDLGLFRLMSRIQKSCCLNHVRIKRCIEPL